MNKALHRSESTKTQVLHRLKIARGHLDKVIQMTESDEYCIDIVHQSLAITSALKKANNIILENHLKTCVAASVRNGDEKEVIDEIMAVIHKS